MGGPGVRGFAWENAIDWLEETLARHGTLTGWARAEDGVEAARGRGPLYARSAPFRGPDGRERWVVRHYRRGGWAAPLLGDRYAAWGRSRPIRELEASVAARARGVRTPAVVAGVVYRAGPVYRADLVTELVPDVVSLAVLLRGPLDEATRTDALRRAGVAVRVLARAGIDHADASAGNVLLGPDGPAWVVDLDRCVVRQPDAGASGARMLARLERSARKICAESASPFTDADVSALRAGWQEPA